MEGDSLNKIVQVGMFYVPFLFSLCVHEFAHGFIALKKGDPTAKMAGRLTLNPFAHADPIGTFVLPIMSLWFGSPIFFGWAQPVPVNIRNLKHPRSDMFWVAAAGPLSNIILAFVGAFALVAADKYLVTFTDSIKTLMFVFIQLNLFLAVFNLLPVHPLDGAKILARFISPQLDYKLQQNQQMFSIILLILFMSGVMSVLQWPVKILMATFINLAGMIL